VSEQTVALEQGAPRPLRLAVTTPWYPGSNNPFAGVFVLHAIEAVQSVDAGAVETTIYHAEDWPTPVDPIGSRVTRWAMRRMTAGADSQPRAVREGTLRRVRVPARPGRGFLRHAGDHVDAVRRVLPDGVIEADVIHAHEGLFGGLVATRLAAPGVPIVVTEHDTRLRKLLSATETRAAYGEILERADRFYAVSEMLADQVRGYVPMFAHKVEVLPNAVAFDVLPMRAHQVTSLDRWLYVGRLLGHKGVLRLVTAFAECARTRPRLTLTVVGGGPMATALQARAAELAVADRVTFRGPVPHEEVQRAMATHDLLVHLSERETFGMTLVEAVSTGLPVLATRSGGPQETMAGLGLSAGRLIDVGSDELGWDVEPVVAAYEAMEADIGALDLPWARSRLHARYSQHSVGSRLLSVYRELAATRGEGANR
jgi:glycosyltransferase involved in cell wall biosynthesis